MAQTLNQAWNQTGYGVLVAFAPRRHELRVLPSPQLSLLENADGLTEIFRKAAQPDLARGDDAAAAASGAAGRSMRRLRDAEHRLVPPPDSRAGAPRAGYWSWSSRVWRSAGWFCFGSPCASCGPQIVRSQLSLSRTDNAGGVPFWRAPVRRAPAATNDFRAPL